jgi:hypothetical protein
VSRRAALDLSLPLAPADPAGETSMSPAVEPPGLSSPLDVPAFVGRLRCAAREGRAGKCPPDDWRRPAGLGTGDVH